MSISLLFSSVGRRVELLQVFRKAAAALGIDLRIVAVDNSPLAPALHQADVRYLVPRVSEPDYIDTLARILRQEKVTAAFPLIDPEIPVLAQNRQRLESSGARLAVVSQEAAEMAGDKWLSNQFFQRLGLEVARSWLPGQLDPADAHYPLFVKPRLGSASVMALRVNNAEELAFFSRYIRHAIVQECLAGPEITTDVACDLEGNLLSVVSRERLCCRNGEVAIGRIVFDPAIAEACARVASALPARGPITVQCMRHEGRIVFTEINARLAGGSPCGVRAGALWPQWLLARLAGIPVEIPPLGSYRTGEVFSRFDESLVLSEDDIASVASRRF